jgi:hypothetical protein
LKTYTSPTTGAYKTQILGSGGNLEAVNINTLKPVVQETISALSKNIMLNPAIIYDLNTRTLNQDTLKAYFFELSRPIIANDYKELPGILKGLLANKDMLTKDQGMAMDPAMMAKLVRDIMDRSAIAIPMGQINPQEMGIAMILASILRNPTEDQKFIIDTITSLLKEVGNIEEESGSPELKKAQDDLLQMVAAVLIAQAIPDLLKEGDVASIKTVFKDLEIKKTMIMKNYEESTKPYYEEVKSIMKSNMTALKLGDSITKKIIDEMPRSELDKLMNALRKLEKRSAEQEAVVRQADALKARYLDPNTQILKESMKQSIQDATKSLNLTLNGAGAAKKK